MNLSDLRKKDVNYLEIMLNNLRRDYFKLRFEKSSGGEFKKCHLFKKTRRNIAKILTIVREL